MIPNFAGVEIFDDSCLEGSVLLALLVLNSGNFGSGGAEGFNALINLVPRSSASSFIITQSAWITPGTQPKNVSTRFGMPHLLHIAFFH